ncbi:MAG: hypothetical protein H6605_01755 [Flavobacteriales bacterium]|nr:hypothetical protein [Flavobacteriales bacterium]
MKNLIIGICALILISSCTNTNEHKLFDSDTTGVTGKNDTLKKLELNSNIYNEKEAVWGYKLNEFKTDFEPVRLKEIEEGSMTGKKAEKIVNKTWPKIQIEFIKLRSDTAIVFIPDSHILTQQMGTAGADHFMITTTYTFTEIPGIKYVFLDFEIGDHANPGVYYRGYWKEKAP